VIDLFDCFRRDFILPPPKVVRCLMPPISAAPPDCVPGWSAFPLAIYTGSVKYPRKGPGRQSGGGSRNRELQVSRDFFGGLQNNCSPPPPPITHATPLGVIVFSARQHICYSALYAIARPSVCLSVCLSVCHTGGSVKDG